MSVGLEDLHNTAVRELETSNEEFDFDLATMGLEEELNYVDKFIFNETQNLYLIFPFYADQQRYIVHICIFIVVVKQTVSYSLCNM